MFVEFVNLLRGKLRQDAYKFLVQKSKHQITIDPNAPGADFTYNQKDFIEMSKYVQSGLSDGELDGVLMGLPNIEMNFIARDMTDLSSTRNPGLDQKWSILDQKWSTLDQIWSTLDHFWSNPIFQVGPVLVHPGTLLVQTENA